MAAIGRRGGEARGANRAARLQQNGDAAADASAANNQGGAQRFQGDREVGVSGNGSAAQNAGGQGTARQSGNSLGGERSTGSTSAERNVERP
jgi:hypothetical protein